LFVDQELLVTGILVKAEDLDVNEVPDGYVIYQIERDRVHYLNKTAAIVFELCDGAWGRDEVVQRTLHLFDLDSVEGLEDVEACIQSLLDEGLVLSRTK
jgi:hypothetical protein